MLNQCHSPHVFGQNLFIAQFNSKFSHKNKKGYFIKDGQCISFHMRFVKESQDRQFIMENTLLGVSQTATFIHHKCGAPKSTVGHRCVRQHRFPLLIEVVTFRHFYQKNCYF